MRHDFRQWQQWMVGGGWDRWWRASRAPKAAGGFGAAAEEQAWGTQFFRAFKCFFYGFVACVVPAKASEPVSRSLGWTTSGGVVLWQLLLLLSPLCWVLAHLRSASEHARRGSLPAARPPPALGATGGPSGAALAPQLRRAGGMGLAGSVLLAAAVRVKVRVRVRVRVKSQP